HATYPDGEPPEYGKQINLNRAPGRCARHTSQDDNGTAPDTTAPASTPPSSSRHRLVTTAEANRRTRGARDAADTRRCSSAPTVDYAAKPGATRSPTRPRR